MNPRRFYVTTISENDPDAWGVEFEDGLCVLRWDNSLEVYAEMDDLRKSTSGRVVWVD
jgi:hypothetical protein